MERSGKGPAERLVCRYRDCPNAAHAYVHRRDDDAAQVTCPLCREALGLPPLARAALAEGGKP